MAAAVIRVLVNQQRPGVRLRRTQRWNGRVHPQPGVVVGGQAPVDLGEDLWGPREHEAGVQRALWWGTLARDSRGPDAAQRRGPLATNVKMTSCLGESGDIWGQESRNEEGAMGDWSYFEEGWLIFNRQDPVGTPCSSARASNTAQWT